ncbi:MAG: hypothetical protein KJO32_03430, partial [Deltaproteobacteria bacterium]|nr:hypothetical protein [Deltaproteobacteria bacterium]
MAYCRVDKKCFKGKKPRPTIIDFFSPGGINNKEFRSLKKAIKESANFVIHGYKVACKQTISDELWLVDFARVLISIPAYLAILLSHPYNSPGCTL